MFGTGLGEFRLRVAKSPGHPIHVPRLPTRAFNSQGSHISPMMTKYGYLARNGRSRKTQLYSALGSRTLETGETAERRLEQSAHPLLVAWITEGTPLRLAPASLRTDPRLGIVRHGQRCLPEAQCGE